MIIYSMVLKNFHPEAELMLLWYSQYIHFDYSTQSVRDKRVLPSIVITNSA